jgi:IMP dehydrogenase
LSSDFIAFIHIMITIAPRHSSGIYLESTGDEAYGVLPGEDRLVKDIMTSEILSIDASMSLKEAIRIIQDRQVSTLIVCLNNEPVLAVTEYDIALSMMESDDHSRLATFHEIIKKREAIRCHEDAILADAVSAMLDHRSRHIPVVDAKGKTRGALSLLNAMGAMTPNAAAKWLTKMRRIEGASETQTGGKCEPSFTDVTARW